MEGTALIKTDPGQEFQTVFKTYYAKVVRYITSIVGQKSTAEDLAQEVFLKLYNLDRGQIQNLDAYLAKASLNAACSYLRSEKRRKAREKNQPLINCCESSCEEFFLRQETKHKVAEILSLLEERERLLLLLRNEGYSYREIAEVINVQPTSVGTLLARAKKQFKELYMKKEEKTYDLSI